MPAHDESQGTSELYFELDAFIAAKRNRAQGTLSFYSQKLGPLVEFLEARGLESVEDVRPQDVRAFLQSLDDHSAGGVRTYFRAVRAFLNWSVTEFGLETDPLANVDPPRGESEPMEAASLDDVAAMLDECDRRTLVGRRDEAIIRCILDTGLRASELLRLNLDDANPDNGDIRVRPEASKTKSPRTVFLGSRALRALRMYMRMRRDDCPALWATKHGTRLSYQGLRSALRSRAVAAGLEGSPTPHEMRKSCATALLRSGTSLEHIRRLLGHTSLATTQKYLRLSDDDVREAVHRHSPSDSL